MNIKGIIGAVIGDIAGSSHEFSAVSSLRFKLFDSKSSFTDDTALTMAVAEWMMDRGNFSRRFTMEQVAPLFAWARPLDNVFLPKSFIEKLK